MTAFFQLRLRLWVSTILIVIVIVTQNNRALAQPTTAVYATTATPGGEKDGLGSFSVTNASDAVPGAGVLAKPNDKFATISSTSTLGTIYSWLQLAFSGLVTASAASPVTVYIRTNDNTTALLGGGVAIKGYDNINGAVTTPTFKTYYLVDGTVLLAVTFTANFRSVRITLSSPVALGTNTLKVYHAFYSSSVTNSSNPYPFNAADCGVPNVTSKSIEGGLISIASIDDPEKAIDTDQMVSKSSFRVFLSVGNLAILPNTSTKLKQTFFFNGLSNLSEAVRLTISQSTALVSASLLGQITLQAYNGADSVGSSKLVNNLIEVDLLNSVGTSPVNIFFAPKTTGGSSVAFDRVEVTLEIKGLALGLGENFPLHIHDVRRVPDAPAAANASACTNVGTVALFAESTLGNVADVNVEYRWYNVIRGGTAIAGAGQTYNVIGLTTPGTFSYYTDVVKTGCTASVRRKVNVTVTLPPSSPAIGLKP